MTLDDEILEIQESLDVSDVEMISLLCEFMAQNELKEKVLSYLEDRLGKASDCD